MAEKLRMASTEHEVERQLSEEDMKLVKAAAQMPDDSLARAISQLSAVGLVYLKGLVDDARKTLRKDAEENLQIRNFFDPP